jgi:hypothetical protein
MEDEEIYEDIYESIGSEKQHLISLLGKTSDGRLNNLRQENNNKMNKLKLLLYQKLINILFSVLGLNLRRGFKDFYDNCKYLKIKSMGFKLDNGDDKTHKVNVLLI